MGKARSIIALVAVACTIPLLSACSQSPELSRYDAAQNALPNTRSTEGRLFNRPGTILERNGAYYLASSGRPLYYLDKQHYAAKFANEPVRVYGFFNYDRGNIQVLSIVPTK
ncbi:MAG TPA: hypothetical protein V6D22_24565 [Candidatus Obscuribacterales bacterium]